MTRSPLTAADPAWLRRVGQGLRLHAWATLAALVLMGVMGLLRIALARFDARVAAAESAYEAATNPRPADPSVPVERGRIKVTSYEGGAPKVVTIDTASTDLDAIRGANDSLEDALRFGMMLLAVAVPMALVAFVLLGLWIRSVFLLTSPEPHEGAARRRSRLVVRCACFVVVSAGFGVALQGEAGLSGSLAATLAFGGGAILARGMENILVGIADRQPNPPLRNRLKLVLEFIGYAEITAMALGFLIGLFGPGSIRSLLLGAMLGLIAALLALLVRYTLLIRQQAREVATLVARRAV